MDAFKTFLILYFSCFGISILISAIYFAILMIIEKLKYTKFYIERHYKLNDGTVILKPYRVYNDGIVGASEDKNHLIYSYDKLVESLSKYYEKDWYENYESHKGEELPNFYEMAIENLDYNTMRSLPYIASQFPNHEPIIIDDFGIGE